MGNTHDDGVDRGGVHALAGGSFSQHGHALFRLHRSHDAMKRGHTRSSRKRQARVDQLPKNKRSTPERRQRTEASAWSRKSSRRSPCQERTRPAIAQQTDDAIMTQMKPIHQRVQFHDVAVAASQARIAYAAGPRLERSSQILDSSILLGQSFIWGGFRRIAWSAPQCSANPQLLSASRHTCQVENVGASNPT